MTTLTMLRNVLFFLPFLGLSLTACTTPAWPDPQPTQADVPFLGQPLTQAQIDAYRADIALRRAQVHSQFAQGKTACYQRFLVNHCLHRVQDTFRAQSRPLHLQDVELNRQSRALVEAARQRRLQDKARSTL